MNKELPVLESVTDEIILRLEQAERGEQRGGALIVPFPNASRQVCRAQHAVILGQRGVGRSTLLRRCEKLLGSRGYITAYLSLKRLEGQKYPHVLIEILMEIFGQFERWIEAHEAPQIRPRWLEHLWPGARRRHRQRLQLLTWLRQELGELGRLLTDESHSVRTASEHLHCGNRLATAVLEDKVDDYQAAFQRLPNTIKREGYLFLDDADRIEPQKQKQVFEYLSRICARNGVWMKVSIARISGCTGHEPTHSLLGADAAEIDLDRALDDSSVRTKFFKAILREQIKALHGLSIKALLRVFNFLPLSQIFFMQFSCLTLDQ